MAPHLLPVVAFCAAFPAAAPGPTPYLQEALGLGAVHPLAQAAVVAALAAAAACAAPTRRWPLFAVATVDVLLRSSGFVLALASYVAATTYRRPVHVVTYALVASAVAALPTADVPLASTLGGPPVFVWLPLATGLWVSARRQVLAGLRERAGRLEREQAIRAEQARAQERARIARDMHDVLAHRVSLMVLHAGALAVNAPDERTGEQAELIRVTGKDALAQLRAVLGVLSGPPVAAEFGHGRAAVAPRPTLADLEGLLAQSRAAGMRVERCGEGAPRTLPVMVEHTAYRVVQEALTNVHRHAGGADTTVTVRYLPAALHVTVANVAPASDHAASPGGGFGLVGLRERVALLDGELDAGPDDAGGFVVSARLPG